MALCSPCLVHPCYKCEILRDILRLHEIYVTDTHRSRTPGDPLSQADHLTPVDLLVVLAGALIVSILHVERPILMGIDVHCTRARNRAAWRTAVSSLIDGGASHAQQRAPAGEDAHHAPEKSRAPVMEAKKQLEEPVGALAPPSASQCRWTRMKGGVHEMPAKSDADE